MSLLQRVLLQLVERRKAERRLPVGVLTFAAADALLLAERYTGPVTVLYASGVKQEVHLQLAPMRIVLDKGAPAPDSERGTL